MRPSDVISHNPIFKIFQYKNFETQSDGKFGTEIWLIEKLELCYRYRECAQYIVAQRDVKQYSCKYCQRFPRKCTAHSPPSRQR